MNVTPNYTYIFKNEDMHLVENWLKHRSYIVFDIETGPADKYIHEWEKNSKIGLANRGPKNPIYY